MLKIYHNTRCSKSRQTLDLIEQAGQEVQIIEYLKEAPSAADLQDVLRKLNMKPEDLVRKGEKLYKEKFAGKPHTDAEWLEILAANPGLIERPIVVKGDKAVIGRPPENVLKLL
ncbi:arsenate reductase (glutaredoxin) [Pontibacter beigongshangensis]|uniref:arsenate reductase (glutaredoxin) n=1 Tax=Pontibacter beigongshangensis TaxID=2574733 RepID=UPI00164F19BF|nr:arsenate reductase (glutaredoxin) [Pontibacter beigongshangensis]